MRAEISILKDEFRKEKFDLRSDRQIQIHLPLLKIQESER
jgi:hypothetical protein